MGSERSPVRDMRSGADYQAIPGVFQPVPGLWRDVQSGMSKPLPLLFRAVVGLFAELDEGQLRLDPGHNP